LVKVVAQRQTQSS